MTEGDAKGVAGKKGVPVAESSPALPGVCDVLFPASTLELPGVGSSGNTSLNKRNKTQLHSTIQNSGMEINSRNGMVHGISNSRTRARTEPSIE